MFKLMISKNFPKIITNNTINQIVFLNLSIHLNIMGLLTKNKRKLKIRRHKVTKEGFLILQTGIRSNIFLKFRRITKVKVLMLVHSRITMTNKLFNLVLSSTTILTKKSLKKHSD
jgi:hypothetical protein